jgi:gamma-glutamyltranspeptidase
MVYTFKTLFLFNFKYKSNFKGGNVTEQDFNDYDAELIENGLLVSVDLDERLTMFGPPPPSSSPLVAFVLRIMNGYGLKSEAAMTDSDTRLVYHRLNEAFKHAYAQRTYFGDIQFNQNLSQV